ncbi:hypothetical protein BGW38_003382 [Lunasporangiospora selenospora]|uniref:Peptide hydrolase n=1 Tax=Lunasporangiospora selenospora TaxID=979761 RepID=A0A9P6KC90_9FUNG|nr:hypothetical protein BGW38_003382 [Lunasporangiospora selenospora]
MATTTPLLQDEERRRSVQSHINQGSWRRMVGIFLLMVISYCVLGAMVSYKRLSLPVAKSLADAKGPFDFAGEDAWAHLGHIAQRPHPINSRDNLRVRQYLIDTLKKLQKEAQSLEQASQQQRRPKGETPPPIRTHSLIEFSDDTVQLSLDNGFVGNTSHLSIVQFYESSNILVRVVGTEGRAEGSTEGRPEAVVVDAHFDSVLMGNGATDAGISVTVCLEMIRNLIRHPVKHNVVFNINNGEEIGLLGAEAFMRHLWAKDVKAFVNLEGAGAGGRSFLFRSSNKALAKFYSAVGTSPHANVVGNDIFKLGLIRSGTDFSVYTANNIPGLDIAFYSRRAFYHTLHDDLEHTSPGAVQHMGNTALTSVRNIADSDYLIEPKTIVSSEASIYYDIAGVFMLVYSFNTYLTLNYNLLIIGPIFIIWALVSSRKHGLTLPVVLRGFLAMLLSFLLALGTTVLFSMVLTKINPMLVYGEHWLGFIFFAFVSFTTIICIQWLWVKAELWCRGGDMGPLEMALERIRLDSEQVANVSMVLFWWVLLLGATHVARTKQIGMFYFVSWFMVTSMISAYFALYPKRRGATWTMARLWINALPLMMVIDIAITNMIAMGQTLVDGTPPFAIMTLFGICALNCIMPLIPTIHRTANYRMMVQVSLFLTTVLLISACLVSPYNATEAPNKLTWRQLYDLDRDVSLVSVTTMNGLEDLLKTLPGAPSHHKCGPDAMSGGVLTQCLYIGAVPPLVTKSKETGKEIIASKVSKPEHRPDSEQNDLLRTVHVSWTAENSRLCKIEFDPKSKIESLTMKGFEEPVDGRQILFGIHRSFDREWSVEVVYRVKDQAAEPIEAILGCLYDEWDQGQIPAFTQMKDTLPPWALLGGGKGPGLLTIQKKIHV